MTTNDLQQEISIIKDMIDKTRGEFVQSGLLFIIPGILTVLTILIVHLLEQMELHSFSRPFLFGGIGSVIITSVFIGVREGMRDKVDSYAKNVFSQIWIALAIAMVITCFFFPLAAVYSWNSIGMFSFPILGIGFYMTGVIYKIKLIQWCSLVWWAGSCIMAVADSQYIAYLIIFIFLLGYILPGYLLNRQYKKRGN